MKKLFVAILLICATFVYAAELKLGKEITLKEKTSVSKILSSPDKFDGKTVLVEGKILGVCEEKGCWIEVAGTRKDEKIKVKVEDGVIVFPKESKGKIVLVEGVVSKVSGEECSDMEKESKDGKVSEKKEGCEKEGKEGGCCSKDKKEVVYQIKGLGAVIR